MRIGLIADTHGLVRPEALAALAGAELILHAGDIGKPAVLEALAQVAPVEAIAGNVDRGWCALPEERLIDIVDHQVILVHDRKALTAPPAPGSVVVCGHSHRPSIERENGVLWVNPGSAGPRRFSLPVGVGWLELGDGAPQASLVTLDVPPPRRRARRSRPQ